MRRWCCCTAWTRPTSTVRGPLDIPLLDGGTRSFVRRAGNWLVLRSGKPVLLIEQQGKKLSALPSASREDVAAAVSRLPSLCEGNRATQAQVDGGRVEWTAGTTTEGRELLEAAGFVRDYQGMTLYAVLALTVSPAPRPGPPAGSSPSATGPRRE